MAQEVLAVFGLFDPAREGAVGNFQDHGITHHGFDFGQPLVVEGRTVEQFRARRRHIGGLQRFRQIDLVGAAQDRARIVDHRNAFDLGLAGKAEGMMIQGRRLADEQGIEFGDALDILGGDEFDLDPLLRPGLGQAFQRHLVRRRQPFVGIDQNGQLVKGRRAALALRRRHADVGAQRIFEHGGQIIVDLVDAERADRLNPPALVAHDLDFQDGVAEGVEHLGREPAEPRIVGPPEEHMQHEPGRGRAGQPFHR